MANFSEIFSVYVIPVSLYYFKLKGPLTSYMDIRVVIGHSSILKVI